MSKRSQEVTSIVVRHLEAGDSIVQLTELLHRAYAPLAASGLHFVASHQTEATTLERVSRGECLVAVAGSELLGTVTIIPPGRGRGSTLYERKGVSSLHQLAVRPDYQRRGIGRRLLDAAEARAAELGAEIVALDTAEEALELRATYERRGYSVALKADWRPLVNYRSVIYAKPVTLWSRP